MLSNLLGKGPGKGSNNENYASLTSSPQPKPRKYDVNEAVSQCRLCHLLHSDRDADKCRRQCCKGELVELNHLGITGLKHIVTPGTAPPSQAKSGSGKGKGNSKTNGTGEVQQKSNNANSSAPNAKQQNTEKTTIIASLDIMGAIKPNKDQYKAEKDLTHFGQALKCMPAANGETMETMEVDNGATATTIASYKNIVATLSLDGNADHVKATIKEYEDKIKVLETPKTVEPSSITRHRMLAIESHISKHHNSASAALRAKMEEIEENSKLLAAQKLQVQQAMQELEVQHQAKLKLIQDVYKHPEVHAKSTEVIELDASSVTPAQNLATNVGKLNILETEMAAFLATTGIDVTTADPKMLQTAMAVGQFCVGRIKSLVVEGSILEAATGVQVPAGAQDAKELNGEGARQQS